MPLDHHTEVSMLGTGNLGATLAGTLLGAGHSITAWNRTRDRAVALESRGAQVAATPAEAIRASDLVLVALLNYDVVRDTLNAPDVLEALAGRTLIVFASGSPRDAREMAQWARRHGVHYLDGVIDCWPRDIGTEKAITWCAGDREAFDVHRPLLQSLGGEVSYHGDDPGRPALLEQSELVMYYCGLFGFLQAAALGEAEGMTPAETFDHFVRGVPGHVDTIRAVASRLSTGSHADPEAALGVDLNATDSLIESCDEHAVDTEIIQFCRRQIVRAIEAFDEGHDITALYATLRRR